MFSETKRPMSQIFNPKISWHFGRDLVKSSGYASSLTRIITSIEG